MIRKIIHIDEEKCNGCGLCAAACHEGAIGMVDGKARLMRDDYCDGLGDCLPACPTGAISFVEREAAAYDEAAVLENKKKKMQAEGMKLSGGCPGSRARTLERAQGGAAAQNGAPGSSQSGADGAARSGGFGPMGAMPSQLGQWPVQIKLAPVNASYFKGANLLVAADCTAYAYGSFHQDFIRGRVTLIGCPKLDMVDYTEKLEQIIRENEIRSLTVVRMEVPCCGGIEHAEVTALKNSGKFIPWQVVTISTDGRILDR